MKNKYLIKLWLFLILSNCLILQLPKNARFANCDKLILQPDCSRRVKAPVGSIMEQLESFLGSENFSELKSSTDFEKQLTGLNYFGPEVFQRVLQKAVELFGKESVVIGFKINSLAVLNIMSIFVQEELSGCVGFCESIIEFLGVEKSIELLRENPKIVCNIISASVFIGPENFQSLINIIGEDIIKITFFSNSEGLSEFWRELYNTLDYPADVVINKWQVLERLLGPDRLRNFFVSQTKVLTTIIFSKQGVSLLLEDKSLEQMFVTNPMLYACFLRFFENRVLTSCLITNQDSQITGTTIEEAKKVFQILFDKYGWLFDPGIVSGLSDMAIERFIEENLASFTDLYKTDPDIALRVMLAATLALMQKKTALLTSDEYIKIIQDIMVRPKINDLYDSYIATSEFEIGNLLFKRFSIKIVFGVLAHEIMHNILHSKASYMIQMARKAEGELLSDIAAFVFFDAMGWEEAKEEIISSNVVDYEGHKDKLLALAKKTRDSFTSSPELMPADIWSAFSKLFRTYEEHQVARAQLWYLLDALRKKGVQADWIEILNIGAAIYAEQIPLTFKEYICRIFCISVFAEDPFMPVLTTEEIISGFVFTAGN